MALASVVLAHVDAIAYRLLCVKALLLRQGTKTNIIPSHSLPCCTCVFVGIRASDIANSEPDSSITASDSRQVYFAIEALLHSHFAAGCSSVTLRCMSEYMRYWHQALVTVDEAPSNAVLPSS